MASPNSKKPERIVIIGGGIIGCTTAFFLSRHPSFNREAATITVIEATSIAAGASGKAGGLLARWAYPKCLKDLSFELHESLATEHDGASRWGYRKLRVGQLEARINRSRNNIPKLTKAGALHKRTAEDSARSRYAAKGLPSDLDWISADVNPSYDPMAPDGDTAQVHPALFTKSMADLAEQKGVKIILGSVSRIEPEKKEEDGSFEVRKVVYNPQGESTTQSIDADTIILTAGPWTSRIYNPAPIESVRAHSVVLRPKDQVSAYALFTEISLAKSIIVAPEIYARPDSTVYVCADADRERPLPEAADGVDIDQERCDELIRQVSVISDELRDAESVSRQACYLPQVSTGGREGPMVGRTHVEGLFIAAGHTCWGIQNAPATGKCIAELVWDGEVKSTDLSSLDPRLFMQKNDW